MRQDEPLADRKAVRKLVQRTHLERPVEDLGSPDVRGLDERDRTTEAVDLGRRRGWNVLGRSNATSAPARDQATEEPEHLHLRARERLREAATVEDDPRGPRPRAETAAGCVAPWSAQDPLRPHCAVDEAWAIDAGEHIRDDPRLREPPYQSDVVASHEIRLLEREQHVVAADENQAWARADDAGRRNSGMCANGTSGDGHRGTCRVVDERRSEPLERLTSQQPSLRDEQQIEPSVAG